MKPLTPLIPHVIMMVGIPGAGKTTFAEHFAKMFTAPYLNPRAFSYESGVGVDQAEKIASLVLVELLKTGRTIVYEGPSETKAERAELVTQAKKAGYSTLLVWVQMDPAEAKRRSMRKIQPGIPLSSDEFENAYDYFQAPLANEKPVVISGRHTFTTQLKVVLTNLARSRPVNGTPPPSSPGAARTGRNVIVR